MTKVILASKSEIRKKLLAQLEIKFLVENSNIDERAFSDDAEILAIEKAKAVSKKKADYLVIGCDQLLEFEGKILHKVDNLCEAKERLLNFSGKIHYLYSGLALCKNAEVLYSIVKKSKLKMWNFDERFIDRYLNKVGDSILNSVACYQIENAGLNLFEYIEGNIYDIMGLPLLELANLLRKYDEKIFCDW